MHAHNIHVLRHDISMFLHVLYNDLNIKAYQEAKNKIQSFIKKQYLNTTPTTSVSFNEIFDMELNKYQQEKVDLSYVIGKIDQSSWDQTYNILIYDLLEKLRVENNEVKISFEQKVNGIMCRVISKQISKQSLLQKNKLMFKHDMLKEYHIYTLTIPFDKR